MKEFKWYFVAVNSPEVRLLLEKKVRSILISYANFKRGIPEELEKARKAGRCRVMLDSGAFANLSNPGSIKLDSYMGYLKEHADLVDEYVTFDDIRSFSNTVKNHATLKEAGLKPLFVDHLRNNPGEVHSGVYKTGEKLCWGNLANLSIMRTGGSKGRLLHIMQRKADAREQLASKAPTSSIHLLGAGWRVWRLAKWLHLVDSFDSSSWSLNAKRYACVWKLLDGKDANAEGWPRLTFYRPGQVPKEIAAEMKSRGYNINDPYDRCRIGIDEFKAFYRAVEKRYDSASTKSEDLAAVIKSAEEVSDEELEDGRSALFFDIDIERPGERWPTLKVADPDYIVTRLASDERTGLLSRVDRRTLVGKRVALVDDERAWGVVELQAGIAMQSGAVAVEKLADRVAPTSRGEFSGEEDGVWFHPMTLVKAFAEPRPIAKGNEDTEKAKAKPVSGPRGLRDLDLADLEKILDVLEAAYKKIGSDPEKADDLFAYAQAVDMEYTRRGEHPPPRRVVEDARKLLQKSEPVRLEEYLQGFESGIVLHRGAVSLVGDIVSDGSTYEPPGLIVRAPLDGEVGAVVKARLADLVASRAGSVGLEASIEAETMITDFGERIDLYDLALVPRRPVIEPGLPVEKADGSLEEVGARGEREAAYQLHYRGKSVHGDLRLQVGDHAIGWTLMVQKPGALEEDVSTTEAGRKLAAGLTAAGNDFHKPLTPGARVRGTPKGSHSLSWLRIDAKAIEPGEVGSTEEKEGVIVSVERFTWEPGAQLPAFREYFLHGKGFRGTLYARQVPGRGGDDPAWVLWFAKSALPYVLTRGAAMPPAGQSWLPKALEDVTPEASRFWTKSGADAKSARDELASSGYFTEENVKLVDGYLRRTVAKRFLALEPQALPASRPQGSEPDIEPWEPGNADEWLLAKADTAQGNENTVKAIVLAKDEVALPGADDGTVRAFSYTVGVGPVRKDEAERWQHVREVNGESFVEVGPALVSAEDARVGESLVVKASELILDDRDGKSLTWIQPKVAKATGEKPDTTSEILRRVREDAIRKLSSLPWEREIPLIKGDALHYVLGPVLEPNDGQDGNPLEPDTQRDVYSAEDIREAAWRFLVQYRRIGEMHERLTAQSAIEVVESYIAPVDFEINGERIRAGTWMLGARVKDMKLWKQIKAGDFNAWSIDGSARRKPLE